MPTPSAEGWDSDFLIATSAPISNRSNPPTHKQATNCRLVWICGLVAADMLNAPPIRPALFVMWNTGNHFLPDWSTLGSSLYIFNLDWGQFVFVSGSFIYTSATLSYYFTTTHLSFCECNFNVVFLKKNISVSHLSAFCCCWCLNSFLPRNNAQRSKCLLR